MWKYWRALNPIPKSRNLIYRTPVNRTLHLTFASGRGLKSLHDLYFIITIVNKGGGVTWLVDAGTGSKVWMTDW